MRVESVIISDFYNNVDEVREFALSQELEAVLKDPLFSEVTHIGITGGEPTLREDLPQLYQAAINALPHIKGLSIITNAIKNEDVIARIDKVIQVVRGNGKHFSMMVSLDGYGVVHDKIRGRDGNFESAISVIDSSDIVVVAASGTTGAGRSAKINLIASEVMGSLSSYKFGGVHQHTPEIEQSLSSVAQKEVKISFTPILAPMPRGILSTITSKLTTAMTTQQAHELYSKHHAEEFFVDLLPIGQMPKTIAVTGSNKVQIQVAVDEHTDRLVVSVAIDNLGKGAAGQAIQNANLICGLSEISGLALDGIGA